jgi:chromosome segregation ATPase
MGFGFSAGDDQKEEDALTQAQELIHNEMNTWGQYRQDIMFEVSEVKHIEHNLQVCQNYFVSLRKAIEIRKKLVREFTKQVVEKQNQHIDINHCRDLINHIQTVHDQIVTLMNELHTTLGYLRTNVNHTLYAEEKNRQRMDTVSKHADSLTTELHELEDSVRGDIGRISSWNDHLNKIAYERTQKAKQSTEPFGFNKK